MIQNSIRRDMYRWIWMVLVIFLTVSCGGGGDGDDSSSSSSSSTASTTITSDGGTLAHSDGVTLEFQEGSFDSDVPVSIQRAQMPEKTTRAGTPVGYVYRMEIDGPTSNYPIKITMPLPDGEGPYTIYRYDGEDWKAAGGIESSGYIETFSTDFSLFSVVRVREIDLLRRIKFTNFGFEDCTVGVANYRLADPVNSPPVSPGFSWPVFAPPFTNEREGYLDIGGYQFCAEYYNDTGNPEYFGWRHMFLGDDGTDGSFTYTLSADTPFDYLPINLYVDFTISLTDTTAGRCPDPQNLGTDPGTNPDGTPINVQGQWSFRLRCAGSDTDAITMTITLNEAGGNFSGSGSGTDYDGEHLEVMVQGGYYAESNTISGTIDINDGAGAFSFQTSLAADTGYFSVVRTAGYGCDAEARFIKEAI